MPKVNEIFPSTEFDAALREATVELDKRLGFYAIQDPEPGTVDQLTLLGFGTPRNTMGEFDISDTVVPVTEYNDLDPTNQNIDFLGKGVGPRMYNTPHAALGLTEIRDEIGAFAFVIDPNDIHDTRKTEGGSVTRILRHASRIVKTRLHGLERVVEDMHASYGDASVVLFSQPPRPAIRQVQREMALEKKGLLSNPPKNLVSEFMIIRDASILLHRVGSQRAT